MAVRTLVSAIILSAVFASASAQTPDVEFSIKEELSVGTVVGNISALDDLFPGLTSDERRSLQYGILNQATVPGSLFNITRNGGVISVANRVDREQLCLVTSDCILRVNILVSSQNPSQIDSKVVTAFFKVEDINDNPPEFENSRVVLKVPERNSLESALKISGANDKDFKDEFKVKNYTMDRFKDVFHLTASQTLDGSSEIDLKLLRSLDREEKSEYSFVVTAYDGGSPAKTAQLQVKVEVTDQNDNEPVFLNDTYHVTIDGKLMPGHVILQVSAEDADEGDNAKISYDFSTIQRPMLENRFHINSSSGEISVVGPLRTGVTEVIVEAQDAGSPRLKAQTSVTITVVSTGNVAPRITITTLGANPELNVVSVKEPAGRGHFVAFVDIVDEDGDISDVTCDISNPAFRMEPISNKGYKIGLQGEVDRESRDTYNLSVVCVDGGQPPLNATASFVVRIEDSNDNKPQFTQSRYSRTMQEGNKTKEFVLQVSASDLDIGANGAVSYSVDPSYARLFSIDQSGQIFAIGNLDRETTPVIKFKVYATDHGKPDPLQSSAEISVILKDVNDNAPKFEKTIFRIRTMEEVSGTRIIETLKAEDKDEGVNAELEFFFSRYLDGADGAFNVLKNGSILSASRLDREDRVNYTFSVVVRDKGYPPLMSTATVVVEVVDINDNSPSILFPKSQNHSILFTSYPETGVVLSKIIAYDDDAGDNGSLKFTIVSGNEDRAFEIAENSGEIQITHASRVKNNKKYNVGFVVSDRGMPPKFNTTTLKIEFRFDNNSNAFVQGDKQEDYIIIVAVVAAVTVVFSTLIIVAICVVFQKDRQSRHKASPKAAFHNLHVPENMSDDEKVHQTPHDISVGLDVHQQYSMNDLSSPPGHPEKSRDDGKFFQTKLSYPEPQTQKGGGKAVSFSLDQNEMTSSNPRHVSSPREETPPLSTFGPAHNGRPIDEMMFHQRSAMTRQGDDVTSDTSGDTNTSDSGRGNSVDDVNFEQIMKGDLSPRLGSRRRSADLVPPARKAHLPNTPGRSSYHVRFAQYTDKVAPPDLPPKSTAPKHYNGARAASTKPVPDFRDRQGPKGNFLAKNNGQKEPNLTSTFGTPRQISMTSIDDDATTTTSGSYVISPDDVRMETFVGSDIIV
ncbi:protocadherin alpha-11 isoform X2 [Aplysia californica]|uniref:Protocadherin alpha-11 isoform X2 n=1 Tax=Aplysia californica TaxID=6500 RepID=A0ABM0JUZ6_APLCA|nr:protocadherin alpha-11 isoform X2 [Aplysia californica]